MSSTTAEIYSKARHGTFLGLDASRANRLNSVAALLALPAMEAGVSSSKDVSGD